MLKAKVIRPDFDPDDLEHPLVKLTATVTHGSVTKEYDKYVKVRRQGVTDSNAIILDLNAINIPQETRNNLVLSTVGANGTTITWVSSLPNIISTAGVVNRPGNNEQDVQVTLTATCTKGAESQTKEFKVKVFAWTKPEELEDAVSLVTWDLVKANNDNSQAITSNLNLPAIVGRGINASWSSSTSNIDCSTGVITRPSYTQGQVTLDLVCTLTQDANVERVTLPTFIIAPAPMTDLEAVIAAKDELEPSLFLGENSSVTQITTDFELPFTVNNVDASRARIEWSLASADNHADIPTSRYISIVNGPQYALAVINRPETSDGNQKVSLKATIKAGVAIETKFFDLTILVKDTVSP